MFKLFSNSISITSKRSLTTASKYYYRSNNKANLNSNSNVPLITITACAITSGSMYYYLMNKVKNESVEESKPVEIVEVVVVEEEAKVGEDALAVEAVEAVEAAVLPNEEEPKQEGAFNEETGEINWDCPCLGGMADGPCGEEFKNAFSCFVYSKEEPKGIECIEKFKSMQDCFRKYPEVYSEELRDEENLESEVNQAVMNNDIIESVEEAIVEVEELKESAKKSAIDIYAAAQKKIDDFNKK